MDQSRLFRNPHFREGSIGHVGTTRVRHRLKRQWSSERSHSRSRERPRDRRNPLQNGQGAEAEATKDRIMVVLNIMIAMRQIVTHNRITRSAS